MKNPNCDNDKCTSETGEVRILPTGGDSNAILCFSCFCHEMRFRKERNQDLAEDCKFKLPEWTSLRVYRAEPPKLYRTFKRSANNWRQFGSSRKITVDTGLTYDEARRQCEQFNKSRTAAQKRKGTMMEFTAL